MAKIDVTIKILSPIHLGSGQADVNVDAEIVRDEFGFPYFPGKRFKGLLYESAVEVVEMFELSGLASEKSSPLEKIFHRHSESDVQLVVPNFFIRPRAEYERLCAEWKYLQWKYPEIFTAFDVLNEFTSLRYQTRLEDGIAADGSLHNLRVLDAGLEFFGEVTLLNADKEIVNLLALAIKNLTAAGTKRNRGFGRIKCTATFDGLPADKLVRKFLAKVA
ncbi:MAG: CRISPR-associated protein [Quinella sp. 3Q1]|nr:CRISPR-associated protein [Quinella sp. 3Q1]